MSCSHAAMLEMLEHMESKNLKVQATFNIKVLRKFCQLFWKLVRKHIS
jgi:hypothetical protein